MRHLIYMAHPVAPTEEDLMAIPTETVQACVGEYEFDLRIPRPHADRLQLAVHANVRKAMRWLSWLRRSFPETTFIAPWIASILSGEKDSDPAQREAGMRDNEAVVERCDGIVLCGGRISSGMHREMQWGLVSANPPMKSSRGNFAVYDLTGLGAEPPPQLCNLTLGGWHPNAFRGAGCGEQAEAGLICLSRKGMG